MLRLVIFWSWSISVKLRSELQHLGNIIALYFALKYYLFFFPSDDAQTYLFQSHCVAELFHGSS